MLTPPKDPRILAIEGCAVALVIALFAVLYTVLNPPDQASAPGPLDLRVFYDVRAR